MRRHILSLFRRLASAFATLPTARGWLESLGIAAAGLALMAAIAFRGGFVACAPHPAGWPLRLLSVMLVPALSEEAAFRGLLIPTHGESQRPALWIGCGVVAFVVWHVVEATTFLPGAHLFLTPAFLAAAGVLGLACALMRYRTGSIWPCVLLHGLAVFAWQVFLGGPDVKALL